MTTILMGVFSEDDRIYQIWAEPPTSMLPEIIRNDYCEALNIQPKRILAMGPILTLMRVHEAWSVIIEEQARADGYQATQVPCKEY